MKKVLVAMILIAISSAPLLAKSRRVQPPKTSQKPTVPVKVYKSNRQLARERMGK